MNTLTRIAMMVATTLCTLGANAQTETATNKPNTTKMNGSAAFQVLKNDDGSEITYTGIFSFKDLVKESSFDWLEQGIIDYAPDMDAALELKKHIKNYKLLVFLGTWCEDSQELIPELFKVLYRANVDYKNMQLIGLDREKTTYSKAAKELVAKYEISLLPTIVVLDKSGKEAGRITETVSTSVEEELLAIVNGK